MNETLVELSEMCWSEVNIQARTASALLMNGYIEQAKESARKSELAYDFSLLCLQLRQRSNKGAEG